MFKISLDKWLKETSKKKKKMEKLKPDENVKTTLISSEKRIIIKKTPLGKLQKFKLKCQSKKCGYQKTIVKTKLTNKDELCPKCSKNMKIEKL